MFFYKKCILTILTSFLCCSAMNAQLEGGIKLGASAYIESLDENTLLLENNDNGFVLGYNNTPLGYQLGLYSRLTVWLLFIQAEGLVNSQKIDYTIVDLEKTNPKSTVDEQYIQFSAPLTFGLKLKWFNLHSGLCLQVPLLSDNDLENEILGIEINKKNFYYSYLIGTGLDIWKFRLDFRYELSTSKWGDELEYKGNTLKFKDSPNRFLLGLSYSF